MSSLHQRVADRLYDELHERILAGGLTPGDRIDPTTVAEEFGVSRTPVREALLRLDAEGLVERVPYRGVVVTGVDTTGAEHIAALRVHVETLAVRAALPNVTAVHIGEMRRVNAEIEACLAEPDAQSAFNRLNREFHDVLYRQAGSEELLRTIGELSARAERIRAHFDVRNGRAVEEHERIAAACEAGDADEAVAATRDHILAVLRSMDIGPGASDAPPSALLGAVLAEQGDR